MRVKLNDLPVSKGVEFPAHIRICEPILVTDTKDDEDFIVLLARNCVMYFALSGNRTVMHSDEEYLRAKHKFIRYLAPGESFTCTIEE